MGRHIHTSTGGRPRSTVDCCGGNFAIPGVNPHVGSTPQTRLKIPDRRSPGRRPQGSWPSTVQRPIGPPQRHSRPVSTRSIDRPIRNAADTYRNIYFPFSLIFPVLKTFPVPKIVSIFTDLSLLSKTFPVPKTHFHFMLISTILEAGNYCKPLEAVLRGW